jgi:glycosyltransferase involved in cell wall biosynthesis
MQRHHKPILTVSGNTRERLLRGGLGPQDVAVLPNGIDLGRWSRQGTRPVLRQELGLRPEQRLVGTVARMTYDKDLPTFYETARLVAAHHPDARFVIVGDGYGDELAQARAEVQRLGLADLVLFTGHRTDLGDIYASLDLFLMTSRTEGMPNTVLEAMALDLPIISTAVGGVPELVADGRCGLLCPPGDAAALAAAVGRLLADDDLRRQFAVASRRRIEEHFDFAARVRTMEDIYAWSAGGGGCRPPAPTLATTEIP